MAEYIIIEAKNCVDGDYHYGQYGMRMISDVEHRDRHEDAYDAVSFWIREPVKFQIHTHNHEMLYRRVKDK